MMKVCAQTRKYYRNYEVNNVKTIYSFVQIVSRV